MRSSSTTIYSCTKCDTQSSKWAGRCLDCGAWGTLVESTKEESIKKKVAQSPGAEVIPFSEINHANWQRIETGIKEIDQVLGGGIVPGSLILLGGEPGIGKCVAADTRVLDPSTGALLPITAWKDKNHTILALNEETSRFESKKVAGFHEQGIRRIVEVRTRLGRSLRCTLNHPLLTTEGWKNISALAIGDRIASPRSLPYFGNKKLPAHHIKLIAYMLSDGSTGNQINITAAIPEIQQDILSLGKKFNVGLKIYKKKNSKAKQFRFTQTWKKRKRARIKFAQALKNAQHKTGLSWAEFARKTKVSYGILDCWRRGTCVPTAHELKRIAQTMGMPLEILAPDLRDIADGKTAIAHCIENFGLRHKKARTKSIPDCIFTLPKTQLALFLKVLFSCDGSVYVNQYDCPGLSYSTISPTLAYDVQHLLLRFGFTAKLRTKKSFVNNKPYQAYELQVLGVTEVKRFLTEIDIWGRTGAKKRIIELTVPGIPSTHRDTIPTGHHFWQKLEEITGSISYKELSRQCETTIHTAREERPLTRMTVLALAERYPAPYLQKLAHSDVYWDEISEIIPAGEDHVYDITVPTFKNFVANDLIIHNSTILAQIALSLTTHTQKVLYCSGEESGQQIKLRLDRILSSGESTPSSLLFAGETQCEKICATIQKEKPTLAIVDSIQTIGSSEVESEAGSISQVRACTVKLLQTAKENDIPIIITGHVTKEGSVAGPKTLEHLVDTVLYLEGDSNHFFRLLKTVKNRFGSTNEVGVFEMTEKGLMEVANPSSAFISEGDISVPGTCTTVIVEGSRAFLVNVQALTSKTYFGYPQRRSVGFDQNRLQLLIAVLVKRLGLNLGDQDIHINIVGGLKINEPGIDLAVCASIISAYKNKPCDPKTIFCGEVGLSGEVRSVSSLEKRLKEAERLGYNHGYIPFIKNNIQTSLAIIQLKNIRELEISS